MSGFEVGAGPETIQVLLRGGIVNAQEFVGGGYHVDPVGLPSEPF